MYCLDRVRSFGDNKVFHHRQVDMHFVNSLAASARQAFTFIGIIQCIANRYQQGIVERFSQCVVINPGQSECRRGQCVMPLHEHTFGEITRTVDALCFKIGSACSVQKTDDLVTGGSCNQSQATRLHGGGGRGDPGRRRYRRRL